MVSSILYWPVIHLSHSFITLSPTSPLVCSHLFSDSSLPLLVFTNREPWGQSIKTEDESTDPHPNTPPVVMMMFLVLLLPLPRLQHIEQGLKHSLLGRLMKSMNHFYYSCCSASHHACLMCVRHNGGIHSSVNKLICYLSDTFSNALVSPIWL